jgi:hypothetical protein
MPPKKLSDNRDPPEGDTTESNSNLSQQKAEKPNKISDHQRDHYEEEVEI